MGKSPCSRQRRHSWDRSVQVLSASFRRLFIETADRKPRGKRSCGQKHARQPPPRRQMQMQTQPYQGELLSHVHRYQCATTRRLGDARLLTVGAA